MGRRGVVREVLDAEGVRRHRVRVEQQRRHQGEGEGGVGGGVGPRRARSGGKRDVGMVGFTDEQKLLAARARASARHYLSHSTLSITGNEGAGVGGGKGEVEMIGGEAGEEELRARREAARRRLEGGVSGGEYGDVVGVAGRGYTDMDAAERDGCERCMRCTGLGYLSCMACAD